GTRYHFAPGSSEVPSLELHLTSPACTRDLRYPATGVVRALTGQADLLDGGSVRVRSPASGLVEEAFLDDRGTFLQELELAPETDNAFEWAVCDGDGVEVARVTTAVRHQGAGRPLGEGGERLETARIEAPPPPSRPTRAEIDEVQRQIDELLAQFTGSLRARSRARAAQLRRDLLEALSYEDEPKAIQRMAELREVLQQ